MENGSWLSKDEIQMARDLIGASSQTFRGPGLRAEMQATYLMGHIIGRAHWEQLPRAVRCIGSMGNPVG